MEIIHGVEWVACEQRVGVMLTECVVGFDNIPTADLVTPPLTTVCQPKQQCGQMAVDLLVDLLNEANGPATRAGSCPCNSS
ncbi:substrate-binding domain-containing protein [Microbispora sp. NPDC088329]|uniref:substrate-binding domain-containing protein n=1 Tax=Microbispora sp. NPDC088329 TaxID=3154869 RepID=UPI00343A4A53